ncbi:Vacuolar protein sorting-associated protein 54 [Halotydeus destructor]|nr:Vacuolar protein sorting-associated protein 54 [Halotydeus destructor]
MASSSRGDYGSTKSYERDQIDPERWTFYSSSQNLVSVLHDPNVPRSYNDAILTKDWGSYFVETAVVPGGKKLPVVDISLFETYIRLRRKREKEEIVNPSTVDSIPKIFLGNLLDLKDLSVFKQVFNIEAESSDEQFLERRELKTLQATLSDYLDDVEENLSKQISSRFRDFFNIMSAIDMVMEQVSKTIKEVTLVRSKCDQLQDSLVKPTMKNIQLYRLRKNTEMCRTVVNLMSEVYHNHSMFHGQLSSKDYVSALNVIYSSKKHLRGKLAKVKCFTHLESEIEEREKLVGALMEEDYCKYLTTEWHRPVSILLEESQISEEDTLTTIVCGLLRLDKFDFMGKFKEEAYAAITSTTKQTLIETLSKFDEIDVSDRSEGALFEKTRHLDYRTWLDSVQQLFDKLVMLIKRIQVIHAVIMNAIDKYSTTEISLDESANHAHDNHTTESNGELQSLLCSICDFTHEKVASLIDRKVIDGSLDKLSSSEFTELTTTVENFVSSCSTISGHSSPSLKEVIQVQANKFATRFHDERRKRLVHLMEIEQWKSVDSVSPEFQSLVNKICDKNDFSETRRNNKNGSRPEKASSYLSVKGEQFLVVNTTQTLVSIVTEYCLTAEELKPLTADILTRLLDLLKYFGQKTLNLVYKGEAVTIAGLKCITVRNLANAGRSLQLVISLIPAIRLHFESVLQARHTNMLKHFEEIVKQYQANCDKICEKMLTLAREQIAASLSKWEAKPPVPSTQFLAIIQYVNLLQSNLEDCLPIGELVDYSRAVHDAFKDILRNHLQRLKIVNDGGPQHGLVTQELIFYSQSLNKRLVSKHTKFTIDDLWSR